MYCRRRTALAGTIGPRARIGCVSLDSFKKITADDYRLLKSFLDRENFHACDYSAGNLVLWSDEYETSYAVAEDALFLRFRAGNEMNFTFPMGARDLPAAFAWLKAYCAESGTPLRMDARRSGGTRAERTYLAEYGKYVDQTVVYDNTYRLLLCILRDVTDEETARQKKEEISANTIEIADRVIDKQMRVVQEIASLLGETTAETKVALTKLKESLEDE